ncbi:MULTISPECIES: LysR family transcriptional regulator [unclassified Microbacterium]|uniref:LysR family transcriptional regulator n=1 Tax=unclassified Microbacterium TaxID=2609290 RepID=UPI002469B93B|nr:MULTISPECIES: LysR family transcriptional regulator [unclassified Microbacterium]MDH5133570.1 LysR family transcriptional regulator [Microbacterium sp. RD10]MDH5138088.1 LysR family transcriptional regulator [Microbacterium sp. RD11]MDH5145973.1 LysR family transcriptional regulator [Microbacterium sp. RD12]MDH5156043.1 LysR family transcriptional regulator [Microbacterium sp. RD06]MDH5167008.1 LysR family transcriptional regulator [Microbacterium sp. RD02]
MELQHLRYVVAVADTGSFTRAAERCHVTQSALSHQVAALERELGVRLFARTSRSVRATEAGEAFLRPARLAVRAADQAREDAAAASGKVVGTLRLGVIPTVSAVDVPALLVAYRAAHPAARVELREGNSDALVAAIRQGDLDAAFLGLREGVEPEGVASRALSREPLVAVVPRGHELGRAREVQLSDLADSAFADFPAGTSGRAQSDAAFLAARVRRDVAFESDTAASLIGLVAAGLAVTLLAPAVVRGYREVVDTVAVQDGPVRVEHLAWDAAAARSAARAFLDIVAEGLLSP